MQENLKETQWKSRCQNWCLNIFERIQYLIKETDIHIQKVV